MTSVRPALATLLVLVSLAACAPIPRGAAIDRPTQALAVDHADGVDAALASDVEALVLAYLDAQGMTGMAVALVDDGQPVYAGGFGWADVEAQIGIEAQTPVLLSSVSKTFVGVAAMQAVEADGIGLDDPAADHLGHPVDNPKVDGETITLRHLLTHHSGVRDSSEYGSSYVEGDPAITLDAFCRGYLVEGEAHWRRGNYAAREPGEGFDYSNVGMACAGEAIGDAGSVRFRDLVRRDILEPLGMSDSNYFLEDLSKTPAIPYATSTGKVRPWAQYGYPTYPDGMMRSTAVDMGRYVAAIASGGELEGARILTEASVAEMIAVDPQLGTDEDGQAIAWAMRELDGVEMIGHNGGDYGSMAELWFDPDSGDGFVLIANARPSSWSHTLDLERELIALIDR